MLLITGITGHSGRYFTQVLVERKYNGPIRCVVRSTSDTSFLDNCGLNVHKCVGDLNDDKFLDQVMSGTDSILNIAGIRYSVSIVNAALRHDVKHIICVHTTAVFSKYRRASAHYLAIEETVKKAVHNSDIRLTILMPTMIYGDLCDINMSKFIKLVDRFCVIPIIDHGSNLIQPVNARDLGKAYYDILRMPPNAIKTEYILSGEKPITLRNALDLISSNLGKKTVFVNVPLVFGVALARLMKVLSGRRLDLVEKVQRMGEDRSYSHREAFRDFGYSPEPFEIGVAREVAEYLGNKKVRLLKS